MYKWNTGPRWINSLKASNLVLEWALSVWYIMFRDKINWFRFRPGPPCHMGFSTPSCFHKTYESIEIVFQTGLDCTSMTPVLPNYLHDGDSHGCHRNWYQYWCHCCLTTWESHHSPRAKPSKLRYQFLFYHDETKLLMNKQILSI